MEGFDDNLEQPVLSFSVEEMVPTYNRAKRGKRIVEKQKRNNSELFSLLTEMREEMKIRDEQLKEELRLRDNNQTMEDKNREECLEALLQQKDEEWREELAKRTRPKGRAEREG